MVEKNERQETLTNFPFETYFVTSYIADEYEAKQHEDTLKEQLLKDFELMGNDELDLVDSSYHLYARQSNTTTKLDDKVNIDRPEVDALDKTQTEVESLIKSNTDFWPQGDNNNSNSNSGNNKSLDYANEPRAQSGSIKARKATVMTVKDNNDTKIDTTNNLDCSNIRAQRTLSESLVTSKDQSSLTSLFMDVRGE